MTAVPMIRIRSCNEREVRPDGVYVLYWITACLEHFPEDETKLCERSWD